LDQSALELQVRRLRVADRILLDRFRDRRRDILIKANRCAFAGHIIRAFDVVGRAVSCRRSALSKRLPAVAHAFALEQGVMSLLRMA
jgi:hypothetical protein